MQPQVAPRRRRPVGTAPVAGHRQPRLAGADHRFAGHAGRDLAVELVDDPHFVAILGDPSAGAVVREVERGAGRHVELRRAPGGGDEAAEAALERLDLRQQGHHERTLQRIVGVVSGFRLLEEEVRHRPEKKGRGGAVAAHVRPVGARAERPREHRLRTGQAGRVGHPPLSRDVEQGQRRVVDVVRDQLEELDHRARVLVGLDVGDHHPLGRSGGAGGVEHRDEVRRRGAVRHGGIGCCEQRAERGVRQTRERIRPPARLLARCLARHLAQHDERFDAPDPGTGDSIQEPCVHDHRPRPRVAHHVRQPVAAQMGVDRHLHRPELREPAPRGDELDAVRQHHEHGLAPGDAARGEAVRDAVRHPIEVAIRPASFLAGDPRRIAATPGAAGKDLVQGLGVASFGGDEPVAHRPQPLPASGVRGSIFRCPARGPIRPRQVRPREHRTAFSRRRMSVEAFTPPLRSSPRYRRSCRCVWCNPARTAQWSSTRPLPSTGVSRSRARVRNETTSPSIHISVRNVSPG